MDGATARQAGPVPQQLRDQDLRRAETLTLGTKELQAHVGADVWGPPPDPWRAAASARPGAPRPPARGGLHRAGLETGSVTPQEPRRAKQAPTKIYLFYLNLVRGPGGPRRPCQHLLAHQAQGPALGGH